MEETEDKYLLLEEDLSHLIDYFGKSLYLDSKKFRAALNDIGNDNSFKIAKNILMFLIDMQLGKELLDVNEQSFDEKKRFISVKHNELTKNYGFKENISLSILTLLTKSLGWNTESLFCNLPKEKTETIESSQQIKNISNSSSSISLVKITGGSFLMGSEEGNANEQPVRNVTVNDFFIGETLVTQAQWIKTIGKWPKEGPSARNGEGDNHPAYYISWYDAIVFCNALSIAENFEPVYYTGNTYPRTPNITVETSLNRVPNADFTKNGYRLPTEAEWEYAAGGGSSNRTKYAGTNSNSSLEDYAWYDNNASSSKEVRKKQPNNLGLYDMSGNVWEWCWDKYNNTYYGYSSDTTNPTGPSLGSSRVNRGGGYYCSADTARISFRSYNSPKDCNYYISFRLARSSIS